MDLLLTPHSIEFGAKKEDDYGFANSIMLSEWYLQFALKQYMTNIFNITEYLHKRQKHAQGSYHGFS